MLSNQFYAQKREQLSRMVDKTILLMGCGNRYRNLPMNHLPFRQDSSFLYFTGCHLPNSALLIHKGETTLFLEPSHPADILWHGPAPHFSDYAKQFGIASILPIHELEAICERHRAIATIAIADRQKNARAERICKKPLIFGQSNGDPDLIEAIIQLRRILDPEEIVAIEDAMKTTHSAHIAAMRVTKPGVHEREVAAAFNYELAKKGLQNAYRSIVTVHGEVLHNEHYRNILKDGDLLLLDGGAEATSGYATDITRTWPVNGTFSPRQRRAYQAVLRAQDASFSLIQPGRRYREVHLASAMILAEFLSDEGILKISPEEAVEKGAHALFFPHGIGHLLGLDVHDMENFGDRVAYPPHRTRSEQFGLSYLRLDLDIMPNMLMTIEPGFYIVPEILSDPQLHHRFKNDINWDQLNNWQNFGGIRIEDNVLCTESGHRVLSNAIPKDIESLEEIVSS